MAEGGFDPTRQNSKVRQLCRYFIHGVCYSGDNCRFIHDRTGTAPANNVCKFYQLGKCTYGSRCRYDHVKASHTTNQSERNPESSETGSQTAWSRSRQNQHRHNNTENRHHNTENRHHNTENRESNLVTLKKGGIKQGLPTKQSSDQQKNHSQNSNWVRATDFVPGQKYHAGATYAKAAVRSGDADVVQPKSNTAPSETKEEDLLCPYFAHGNCQYEPNCVYIHGDVCDICQLPRLHPTDTAQREGHKKECLKEMEKDMEHSFAIQESQDKECCICLELVLEKAEKEIGGAYKSKPSDQLFGILENCSHCFCLSCIRRWRSDKSFGKNARACPICRVHSDFVTPSGVWVEDEEKKKKVIQDYKDALSLKHCQYFKRGKGECPFNEKCFYKHAYPDGTIAKPKPRKPRRRVDADGDSSTFEAISLWDFLETREDGFISLEDELSLYLLGMLQDSDDDSFRIHPGWLTDSDSDSDELFFF